MQPISYLIARGQPASRYDWNQPYITYTPPTKECDQVRIGSYDDHSSHSAGGESELVWFLKNSSLMSMLDSLGGMWFAPFMRRMAAGETVPIEEIAAAYEKCHGVPLESKPLGARFFASEQAAAEWAWANPMLRHCLLDIVSEAARLANSDWGDWQRTTAKVIHSYIERHYLENLPPPPESSVSFAYRSLVRDCVSASKAAVRENVVSREAKLAALAAPNIKALGKETYSTLFAGQL
jgi:hypothetical protein